MQPLKIWITEYTDDASGVLIGPYIKAETLDKAIEIADMYALTIIGELYELTHNLPEKKETIH